MIINQMENNKFFGQKKVSFKQVPGRTYYISSESLKIQEVNEQNAQECVRFKKSITEHEGKPVY